MPPFSERKHAMSELESYWAALRPTVSFSFVAHPARSNDDLDDDADCDHIIDPASAIGVTDRGHPEILVWCQRCGASGRLPADPGCVAWTPLR